MPTVLVDTAAWIALVNTRENLEIGVRPDAIFGILLDMPDKIFSLLPLGEGPGMRVCESGVLFSYLCSGAGEWHSKTKTSIGVDAAVSPHPNPLPVGEGDKGFLIESRGQAL